MADCPKPGDVVADKYRIERIIGDGGMSVVFGATHRVTGKRFAVKWLLPDDEATTSVQAAERFIREAQVAGLFQHPNVVEVYDVGEISGSFYMVMEWLEGESLAARLDRVGRLSLQDACAHLIPCMHGVDDAHAVGIIHRDLKPANIFVCQPTRHAPERAKVLDFGIAKLTAPEPQPDPMVTETGVLVGTPYYLSLEQLRGQPIDHRADIYAFGVVLYQVLSGELPFAAENFSELVLQIATGTPMPLRERVPELPDGVDEVVARAMARDPEDRFQHLGELVDALESLPMLGTYARSQPSALSEPPALSESAASMDTPLSTETPLARSARSSSELEARPPRRARPRVTIAVAVAGVALAVTVWLQWFAPHPREPRVATPANPVALTQLHAAVTETAVMAATPEPNGVEPAPVLVSTDKTFTPEPPTSQPVKQPVPQPLAANHATPRAPIVRAESVERPRAAHTETPQGKPYTPQPSAPDRLDHNPLRMRIQ